jgi:large subunit ribosomal protein L24
MKIRVGDMVKVIAGGDRNQTGKVLTVNQKTNKIVVEGVNVVFKHVKPSRRNPQGGRLEKEMPIPVSNVMVLCPKTNKPTRIGYRFLDDGSKERYARVSGAGMGLLSGPKETYAKAGKR